MSELPHKRFSVTIKIDGHDWEEARTSLLDVLDHVLEHGSACSLISSGQGWVHIEERPEMTKEKYDKELQEWAAQRKAAVQPQEGRKP